MPECTGIAQRESEEWGGRINAMNTEVREGGGGILYPPSPVEDGE